MPHEETVERSRFHSFCKVVLRHEMLNCFREFSYQNKWLVSLNYLPPSALDGIYTAGQDPSDYTTASADGYALQISNERLAISSRSYRSQSNDFRFCASGWN